MLVECSGLRIPSKAERLTRVKHTLSKRMKTGFLLLICLFALAVRADVTKPFPAHWGEPPKIQTRDYRELPGGYGNGSSTLAKWIEANLAKDAPPATNAPAARPLFECDFNALVEGPLPDLFMVMQGEFAVKDLGTNKVMELPGSPLDSYSVLFGPVTNANVAVSAQIFGTAKGRRQPTFGVGLGGVAGYKLQIAPGKKAAELMKDATVLASAPFAWESGAGTHCKLQVRQTGESTWRVEAKAWKHGAPEPEAWLLTFEETEKPFAGQASVLGSPFAGTPIQFDELKVSGGVK
jgi:hypothetical protein